MAAPAAEVAAESVQAPAADWARALAPGSEWEPASAQEVSAAARVTREAGAAAAEVARPVGSAARFGR